MAPSEFGEEVAKHLKLSADGTKILWPQPTDEAEDPQNVRMTPVAWRQLLTQTHLVVR